MHITVQCPGCQGRYHVEPTVRGRQMRCPGCHKVFEARPVEDAVAPASAQSVSSPVDDSKVEPAQPAPRQQGTQSGSVGDLVPILSAEAVTTEPAAPASSSEEPSIPASSPSVESVVPLLSAEMVAPPAVEVPAAPREATAPPSWENAPPPIRQKVSSTPPGAAPPERKPKPGRKSLPPAKKEPAKPVELPPGAWDAPPIRRPTGEAAPAPSMVDGDVGSDAPVPRARRRAPWIIAGMLLTLTVVVGAGAWLVLGLAAQTEDERLQRAQSDYQERKYASAADRYRLLQRDFPESERLSTYQFFEDLSTARDQAYRFPPNPGEAYEQLRAILRAYKGEQALKQQAADLGETFAKIADDWIVTARESLDPALLAQAEEAAKEAERFGQEVRAKEVRALSAAVRVAIERKQRRQELLVALRGLVQRPTTDADDRARQLIEDAARAQPDLRDDRDVRALLVDLRNARRELVTWTPGGEALEPVAEENEASLLIVPALSVNGASASEAGARGVVFALARGVLYALDAGTGQVRWATRVGIDTTALPVRLPATETSPEIVLVLSSDSNTLTARDVQSGQALWRHRLTAPCLGRPVLVERRAYVPTYDGRVHEIEIVEGKLLGWYDLGQPLSVGGTHQEGTNYLYFPADSRHIYVLDCASRRPPCVAIIHSDHPSGSLRGEPILISREEQRKYFKLERSTWPDYLILNQAADLGSMKLRAFALTSPSKGEEGAGPGATPLSARSPQVQGWSWFPPYHDSEKLIQVTDAGVVGIIGINQVRNQDKDLFLENRKEIILENRRPGRAQVVHAREDDIWILAQGELRLFHFDRFGQRLAPAWSRPLPLGSPLHASQLETLGATGRKMLYLVTQSLTQPTCLATAVDGAVADSGHVRWQRQLGLLCRGEPLALGKQLLAIDAGGSLFLFDTEHSARPRDQAWQIGGQLLSAGPSFGKKNEEAGEGEQYLLPGRDGATAFAISSGKEGGLLVRRCTPGKKVVDRTLGRQPPLAGMPGVGDDCLVLALADGKLMHLPLDDRRATEGPAWRGRHADRAARGHVVHGGDDEFLTTDGSRGLTRWRWPGGPVWEMKATLELPERLIAPPLLLPRGDAKDDWLVCVADARGTLTLLRDSAHPKGGSKTPHPWTAVRTWGLGGKITAGPFRRGAHIFCVVDQHRLVCLDPGKDKPVWEYSQPGEAIVGQPQLVEELLLIAHVTGRFVGLEPGTGKPLGPGYRLQANVAPAAAPVAYGVGQAFAPLTDGTVLLLSLRHIRHPLAGFPAIW